MPLPLLGIPIIIKGAAVVAGAVGVRAVAKDFLENKESIKNMNSMKEKLKQKEAEFNDERNKTDKIMETLGIRELEIVESFKAFSGVIARIQNRPDFQAYSKGDIEIPKYDTENIQNISVEAAVLLNGLTGGATGAAAGFAAAGVIRTIVMTFGVAGTGAPISGLTGVAAVNAAMALLGGGTLAAGGGGIALGATVLSFTTFGFALLVGGIVYKLMNASVSDDVKEALNQMMEAEENFNKICDYLRELREIASKYNEQLDHVDKIFKAHMKKLTSIVSLDKKTDWNTFTAQEKLLTEDTILLVGVLYNMCSVQLVLSSENDTEPNSINIEEINRTINNTDKLLDERGLVGEF